MLSHPPPCPPSSPSLVVLQRSPHILPCLTPAYPFGHRTPTVDRHNSRACRLGGVRLVGGWGGEGKGKDRPLILSLRASPSSLSSCLSPPLPFSPSFPPHTRTNTTQEVQAPASTQESWYVRRWRSGRGFGVGWAWEEGNDDDVDGCKHASKPSAWTRGMLHACPLCVSLACCSHSFGRGMCV